MSCRGDCCVAFPISCSLETLRDRETIVDRLTLLDMLEPITADEARERRARFGVDLPLADENADWFRCNRWDETTRLCTRYADRPDMCRSYPYGSSCEHGCGCSQDRVPVLLWEGDQA